MMQLNNIVNHRVWLNLNMNLKNNCYNFYETLKTIKEYVYEKVNTIN